VDVGKHYIPKLPNNYTVITESGLYSLIIGSKKPEGKKSNALLRPRMCLMNWKSTTSWILSIMPIKIMSEENW